MAGSYEIRLSEMEGRVGVMDAEGRRAARGVSSEGEVSLETMTCTERGVRRCSGSGGVLTCGGPSVRNTARDLAGLFGLNAGDGALSDGVDLPLSSPLVVPVSLAYAFVSCDAIVSTLESE